MASGRGRCAALPQRQRARSPTREQREAQPLFKLFMGDTGLLCAASMGNVQLDVHQGSLEVHLGSTVENAVAQELHSHVFGLHFFNSKREGEADNVVQDGTRVLPVEVKSGDGWKRHQELDSALDVAEWGNGGAYVFCKGSIERVGRITHLPPYASMLIEPLGLQETLPYEVDLSALG